MARFDELINGTFKAGELLEYSEWASGHDPSSLWWPCKEPERPIDINAARVHLIRGEPCAACEIAKDAALRRGGKYTKPNSPGGQ